MQAVICSKLMLTTQLGWNLETSFVKNLRERGNVIKVSQPCQIAYFCEHMRIRAICTKDGRSLQNLPNNELASFPANI